MFEDMLEQLVRVRDRGDIEVLTVGEVVGRIERCSAANGLNAA
jgi:hypothetical protein